MPDSWQRVKCLARWSTTPPPPPPVATRQHEDSVSRARKSSSQEHRGSSFTRIYHQGRDTVSPKFPLSFPLRGLARKNLQTEIERSSSLSRPLENWNYNFETCSRRPAGFSSLSFSKTRSRPDPWQSRGLESCARNSSRFGALRAKLGGAN